jgi:chorismate mutase/prephenate dehydratase
MLDLAKLREEIDEVDTQIQTLFERRMDICREVAAYKIENGKKVFDKEREESKLVRISAKASNDFYAKGAQEVFEQIMSISRKMQYQLLTEKGVIGNLPFVAADRVIDKNARVVYQGVKGAYSEQAMKKYFGDDVNGFAVEQWRDAMEAIEEGMADYAVLPIENSSAGIVSQNYDLLVEFENYIVDEVVLQIKHALLGVPGAKLQDIEVIYSHPQALMQSEKFLQDHRNIRAISVENTAVAAKKVADEGDIHQAAIASSLNAKLYGLDILEPVVNYNDVNSTRFIIVTNQKVFRKDAGKISICFELPHTSGSLYRMLAHFIYNDLNMDKIESRPIPGRNWEYRFFIDFEGNLNDSAVKNALRGIRNEAMNLKILGNY